MVTNNAANNPTGASGTILQGQGVGTASAFSTATYPATTTVNQILYSSATNTVAGITAANNGVLITSAGGVPSISSTLPSAVQGNITAVGTIASGTWSGTAISASKGGSLRLIATQTASASATISFTGLTAVPYLLVFTGIQPVTNAQSLQMVVSQDNGGSYLNTGYLAGVNYAAYNSTTLTNSNSTTFCPITGPLSNADIAFGFMYIGNANIGNGLQLTGQMTWNDTTLATIANGQLTAKTSTGINAIQFAMASGNINAGVFSLYGIQVT